ncbi:acyl carrier protein [Treponema bryantii]|uniref:acyl carrier protein n=1 Tax=Treponema bryantii TaxID=163 RepID=UPI002B2DFEA0|nr:hypothetical protein TRBR_26990 [Treponema bryantii]
MEEKIIEECIKKLWIDILELDNVDFETDFYDLGGNSLKLVLLLSAIDDQFDVELDVADFIEELSLKHVVEETVSKINDKKS